MDILSLSIFYLSLFIIFYVYIGYPLFIAFFGIVKPKPIKTDPSFLPYVTILIAAYNEEGGISETIKNKLNLDYPKEKLEILVVSDGSSDGTDQIVKNYGVEGVSLLRQEPRAGKTQALNMAIPYVNGEIIVFSDANSIYDRSALKMIVRNFADQNVGYVTGKMVYANLDGSTIGEGCSVYMKYENIIRAFETRTGSIVGVDGGIDAARKELYIPMRADQLPDFILPLRVVEQGYRVIYESEALLREPALKNIQDEHRMRVRVTLRALWALYDMRILLSIKRYGLFALQLWSHKVLRYLCFVFLIGAYGSNLLLWNENVYFKVFFLFQSIVYAGAILSPYLEKMGLRFRALFLLRYFILGNFSAAYGFLKFLRGQKQVIWTPRKG